MAGISLGSTIQLGSGGISAITGIGSAGIQGASDLPITTADFAVADVQDGIFGYTDSITTSGRAYWEYANNTNEASTAGAWKVTGTDCTFYCNGGADQPFWFSVDDGAEFNPHVVSGQVSLFSGLTNKQHIVRARIDVSYNGGSAWTLTTGNLFTVTGRGPNVIAAAKLPQYVKDSAFQGLDKRFSLANSGLGSNFRPTGFRLPSVIYGSTGAAVSGASTLVWLKTSELWAYTSDAQMKYAVDNGALQISVFPFNSTPSFGIMPPSWQCIAKGLDNTAFHKYHIVSQYGQYGGANPNTALLGIGIAGTNAAWQNATATKSLTKFGNSITNGRADLNGFGGEQEYFYAAQSQGVYAVGYGHSGITTPQMATEITSVLSDGGWPVTDAALIELGANDDVSAGNQTTWMTAMTSIINQLLSAGYNKVALMGVAPDQTNIFTANVDVWGAAVVATIADARVRYIDVSTWTNIATNENPPYSGTHPTNAGYITMGNYLQANTNFQWLCT